MQNYNNIKGYNRFWVDNSNVLLDFFLVHSTFIKSKKICNKTTHLDDFFIHCSLVCSLFSQTSLYNKIHFTYQKWLCSLPQSVDTNDMSFKWQFTGDWRHQRKQELLTCNIKAFQQLLMVTLIQTSSAEIWFYYAFDYLSQNIGWKTVKLLWHSIIFLSIWDE